MKNNNTKTNCITTINLVVIILMLSFSSCDTVQEHYQKQTNKCIESKWEMIEQMRGEGYPKSVEAAIAKYDYEVAHIYAECYPTDDDAINSQASINERISRSEISYYVMQCNPPEITRARAIAAENNLQEVFDDVYRKYLHVLLEKKNYDEVINQMYLVKLPAVANKYQTEEMSEYEAKEVMAASWKEVIGGDGFRFNKEINDFFIYDKLAEDANSLLDVIINEAIRSHDRKLADDCLRAYKQRVQKDRKMIKKSSGGYEYFRYTFTLTDSDKNAAKKRLKEAKM